LVLAPAQEKHIIRIMTKLKQIKTYFSKKKVQLVILLSLVLLLVGFLSFKKIITFFGESTTISYYVSTTGNDNNPGTSDQPFLTIERARDKIRELKQAGLLNKPVNINVKSGTYNFTKPLEFKTEDSGTTSTPITYQSDGGAVTFSGGEKVISAWSKCTINDANCRSLPVNSQTNVFYTDLSNDTNINQIVESHSLFVNSKRASRTRLPNDPNQFYRIQPNSTGTDGFYFNPGDINPEWKNIKDVQTIALYRFLANRRNIDSVSNNKVILAGTQPTLPYNWGNGGDTRYYVENVFEALSSPGQWYLDRVTKKLYYYPIADENIDSSTFTFGISSNLLQIGKIPDNNNLHGSFSVAQWVNTTSEAGQMYIMGGGGYGFGLNGGNIYFFIGSATYLPSEEFVEKDCGINKINDGAWHHIAGVFDLENKKFVCYKDGTRSGEVVLPRTYLNHADTLPMIGKPSSPMVSPFDGKVDEYKIYHQVLDDSDISKLYQGQALSYRPMTSLSFEDNLTDDGGQLGWSMQADNQPKFVEGPPGFGKAIQFDPNNTNDRLTSSSIPDATVARTSYINFKGLNFSFTDGDNTAGKSFDQGALDTTTPPTVGLNYAKNISFQNCNFAHLGGMAVDGHYVEKINISDNTMSDLGHGGILIRDGGTYVSGASFSDGNTIVNNSIHDIGLTVPSSIGIMVEFIKNTRVANNEIYNGPYDGISLGWFWSKNQLDLNNINNIVEKNYVHNVMQLLADGAGIYATGDQPGTQIRNNIVTNVVRVNQDKNDSPIMGIYLDGSSLNIVVANNIVFNNNSNLLVNWNLGNTITNNIFANPKEKQIMYLSTPPLDANNPPPNNVFQNNIVFESPEEFVYVNADIKRIILKNNLYFDTSGQYKVWILYYPQFNNIDLYMNGLSEDTGSIKADPQFNDTSHPLSPTNTTDPRTRDYSLRSTSPAFGLGFKQIDTSTVGPQPLPSPISTLTPTPTSTPTPTTSNLATLTPTPAPSFTAITTGSSARRVEGVTRKFVDKTKLIAKNATIKAKVQAKKTADKLKLILEKLQNVFQKTKK